MRSICLQLSTFFLVLFLHSCDRNDNQPEIADQVFYLDENSKTGTLVGKVEADDLDEQQTLSFEIAEGNTDNAFVLEKETGILVVNNPSVLDYEKIKKIDLQVVVSDNHTNEPMESTAKVSVVLNNLNEYAPEIEDQKFQVDEKCLIGTLIGEIVASDKDPDQSLSFRIESGNENQVIHLDTLTGELTVKDSTWFDYNVNKELVCMVSVCDNDSLQPLKSYSMVTIEVVDIPFITIDISGYVQKGPFILGSSITITELNNALQPTGRIFSTQITENTGKYELPSVELESRYILLKAEGFYYNERTSALSEAQLTLYNLVDISDQESFNINVVSHLEKDRIIELINGGMEYAAAKLQAKNEVLGIFGFAGVEQIPSEQMNIASSGEDNAMLLAISLILQGYRSTGEFSEILNQISQDFKNDGTMDSELIGSELINGINYANLPEIRQFIEQRYEGLGIEYEIPDFEKYVNQFIDHTSFVPTNDFVFPEYGIYGLNVLHSDITEVEPHTLNETFYSMAVNVPDGRSFKVKINGGCYFVSGSNINMENYSEEEPVKFTTFSSTSSGLCDVKVLFLFGRFIPANSIYVLEYYSEDNTEPFFTKEVEVLKDSALID